MNKGKICIKYYVLPSSSFCFLSRSTSSAALNSEENQMKQLE